MEVIVKHALTRAGLCAMIRQGRNPRYAAKIRVNYHADAAKRAPEVVANTTRAMHGFIRMSHINAIEFAESLLTDADEMHGLRIPVEVRTAPGLRTIWIG